MGWPSINGITDGEQVVAGVFNRPIAQLAERTEYLRRQIDSYGQGTVFVSQAELSAVDTPEVGDVVYRKPDGSFAKARASALPGDILYAGREAMAVGIVAYRQSSTTASIVLSGRVSLNLPSSSLISDSGAVTGGRYYLSDDPRGGKVTAYPKGPVIYVGDYHVSSGTVVDVLVNPQYHDFGSSHTHMAFKVSGLPMGAAVYKDDTAPNGMEHIEVTGLPPDGSSGAGPRLVATGGWYTTDTKTYEFELSPTPSSDSDLSSCRLVWDTGSASVVPGEDIQVENGLCVRVLPGLGGAYPSSCKWTVSMPEFGQRWYTPDGGDEGSLACNLKMYPEMSRYVPPNPKGAAVLTVDGVEAAGEGLFDDPQWRVTDTELIWCGTSRARGANTASGPFSVEGGVVSERHVVFYTARAGMGPTGFVTSLAPVPGSPLKVVSAYTAALASSGDLQIGLDVDFTARDNDKAGYKVVKGISGSSFELGPVVERVRAGAGISITSTDSDGHGTVLVSIGDGEYSGDFETVALENAKQDLAGGVFPYTKLLGWDSTGGASNVNTAFTAKFRVPDSVFDADGGYNVALVASVFGERDESADSYAGIELSNFVLPDQAFSSRPGDVSFSTGLVAGYKGVVAVPFKAGYSAFDPITVHGLEKWKQDTDQRVFQQTFLLRSSDGHTPIVVRPGWFVGIRVARSRLTASTEYKWPLGFIGLRWSLIQAG